MSLGGASESSYVLDINSDNIMDNCPREKKTQTQCYINEKRDAVDGCEQSSDTVLYQ
jgi:hypothetical protein